MLGALCVCLYKCNIDDFYTLAYMGEVGLGPIVMLRGLILTLALFGELNLDLGLLIGSFND